MKNIILARVFYIMILQFWQPLVSAARPSLSERGQRVDRGGGLDEASSVHGLDTELPAFPTDGTWDGKALWAQPGIRKGFSEFLFSVTLRESW